MGRTHVKDVKMCDGVLLDAVDGWRVAGGLKVAARETGTVGG
jgi:hypothetical protein